MGPGAGLTWQCGYSPKRSRKASRSACSIMAACGATLPMLRMSWTPSCGLSTGRPRPIPPGPATSPIRRRAMRRGASTILAITPPWRSPRSCASSKRRWDVRPTGSYCRCSLAMCLRLARMLPILRPRSDSVPIRRSRKGCAASSTGTSAILHDPIMDRERCALRFDRAGAGKGEILESIGLFAVSRHVRSTFSTRCANRMTLDEKAMNCATARTKAALASLCLLVLLLIAFAPAVFGGKTLLLASWDTASIMSSGAYDQGVRPPLRLARTPDPGAPAWQTEAWFSIIADQFWSEFNWPLWNPYNAYGTPLAASGQPQPFFPLATLLSLHLTAWTYNLFI